MLILRASLPACALLAALALACTDSPAAATPEASAPRAEASAATDVTGGLSSPTPTEVAPNVAAVPGPVSVERALEHVRVLSVDIGSRPAGTAEERAAAAYIADTLRTAGYAVSLEEFPFETEFDTSTVTLRDGATLSALSMRGGALGEVSGMTVFAGVGELGDLAGVGMSGRIVVFDRGVVPFSEKVRAAEVAGARAVIVVNHERGLFRGTLGEYTSTIPVLAVEGEARDALMSGLGQRITVNAAAGSGSGVSQNVVAKAGGDCQAYLGAHYDSVPEGPGANDNASGVAVVLEVARAQRTPGLCVVAFGAEEIGLWGSRAYVREHLAGTARFMLNVDMAGVDGGPVIVGDRELTTLILDRIKAAGINTTLKSGRFPPFSSSDHVSFSAVGVPAVTFNAGDDPRIHTADDTVERIEPATLGMFLQAVDAALAGLLAPTVP